MFKLPENIDCDDITACFPGNLYIKDIDGRYLGINECYMTLLGYVDPNDIIGKTDHDLWDAKTAQALIQNDQRVMQENKELVFKEENHTSNSAYIFISQKRPLYDREGNIAGIIGTSVDFTCEAQENELLLKQVLQLNEMKQQKKFMDNILWRLPEQFYWLDLEGHVIACNEAQAKLFGLSRSELIGMTAIQIAKHMGWDRKVGEAIRANDIEVMQTGKSVVREENYELEGIPRTMLSYKNPLYDMDNQLVGVFGVSVDITERKAMEFELLTQKHKAEAANKAKTEFLMNISHDIRTPFSGITGLAEILKQQEQAPEKQKMMQQIIDSSQYLLGLLNNLIDVVQLEGEHELVMEPTDIRMSVKQIINLFTLEAKNKKLSLNVNIDDTLPNILITNAKSIERILLNLLGNAIKFTHTGSVNLNVTSTQHTDNTVTLIITICDTGIGIAQSDNHTIFDKFTRVSPSYHRNYQGSGLGLWIVKELIDRLDGDIELDSTPGEGTRVTIRCHCTTPNSEKSESQQECANRKMDKLIQSILVVEDEPIAALVGEKLLAHYFSAQIDIAKNGQDALKLAKQTRYDVILMDIGLPDMSGVEVARKIKQESTINAQTPIIGLTAHARTNSDETSMIALLQKPLTNALCEKIDETLQLHYLVCR